MVRCRPQPPPGQQDKALEGDSSTGAIVGGAVGGGVVLLFLGFFVARRRSSKNKNKTPDAPEHTTLEEEGPMSAVATQLIPLGNNDGPRDNKVSPNAAELHDNPEWADAVLVPEEGVLPGFKDQCRSGTVVATASHVE